MEYKEHRTKQDFVQDADVIELFSYQLKEYSNNAHSNMKLNGFPLSEYLYFTE